MGFLFYFIFCSKPKRSFLSKLYKECLLESIDLFYALFKCLFHQEHSQNQLMSQQWDISQGLFSDTVGYESSVIYNYTSSLYMSE